VSLLTEIVEGVRADLLARKADVSPATLRRRAASRGRRMTPEPVAAALRGGDGVRLTAEVKRAGPSTGPLAAIDRPGPLAAEYVAGGAAAISALTEARHFGGSLDDLRAVRATVGVPLLRKDFLVDPYQLAEAAAAGADLVLLIVAALAAGARIVGVNARDLATFRIDRHAFARLSARIPDDVVTVAESGLRGPADVGGCAAAGADAVLVGSALVTDARPAEAVAAMVAAGRRGTSA
jgi:indole-3-glycerol phosphate synthase